ncbi:MAG: hypothetical protein KDC80_22085 [Saprospiraceae bacterium]|nr:hypothetical protein [Saprospiraceae bacterium]
MKEMLHSRIGSPISGRSEPIDSWLPDVGRHLIQHLYQFDLMKFPVTHDRTAIRHTSAYQAVYIYGAIYTREGTARSPRPSIHAVAIRPIRGMNLSACLA